MLIFATLLVVLQLAMAVGADLCFKIERLTALLSATVLLQMNTIQDWCIFTIYNHPNHELTQHCSPHCTVIDASISDSP